MSGTAKATLNGPAGTLWRAVLDPATVVLRQWTDSVLLDEAERFSLLLGPALAAHFLAPVAERLGVDLLAPGDVTKNRLMNRYTGGVQRSWMHRIAATGIPVVYMKGFVFAHNLYPDPDIRTIGDMDILVRGSDLDPLLEFLTGEGFRFDELPSPAWGFISDASFMPLMSESGDCNIDIHVQPDCYPAYRSLTADDVFAQAVQLEIDGTTILAPAIEHALLLCLTNAAKDKFGPFSVRKIVDLVMLLRSGRAIDWNLARTLSENGHFLKPARTVFALLRQLGMPDGTVPDDLAVAPGGVSAAAFRRLVTDYERLFVPPPPALRIAERELTLCTEPDVALHNLGLRITGLFRRRRGLPKGYA